MSISTSHAKGQREDAIDSACGFLTKACKENESLLRKYLPKLPSSYYWEMSDNGYFQARKENMTNKETLLMEQTIKKANIYFIVKSNIFNDLLVRYNKDSNLIEIPNEHYHYL